jgi:ssDNA-binding Zn-finger/Zn-ribbon topoisomerase 1
LNLFFWGKMARPKKEKPTCETCGRSFDRQNNLEWHRATHVAITGETPVIGEDQPMAEACPNCHTLEHTLEKRDGEIERMGEELRSAAATLKRPPEQPGHSDFQQLLDCPSCGPPAVKTFELAGGAVLPPGRVKPALVGLVKKHYKLFGTEVEVPSP